MELTGEYRIAASRETVWEALNDPEILKASIPGCTSLEAGDNNSFSATVTAKVGPVKAKFQGQVTLSDLDPPNGYTIQGEGKGGPAGFAKGGAKIRLESDGDGTLLHYEVTASIGGKLAQIGSRLIDGTARKLSGEFFETFSQLAASRQETAPAPAPAAAPAVEPAPPPAATPEPSPETAPVAKAPGGGLPTWVWLGGVIVVVVVVFMLLGGD